VRDGSVLATRVLHPLEQPLRLGGGQLAVEERQVDLSSFAKCRPTTACSP
jgi:hypothetical protein